MVRINKPKRVNFLSQFVYCFAWMASFIFIGYILGLVLTVITGWVWVLKGSMFLCFLCGLVVCCRIISKAARQNSLMGQFEQVETQVKRRY